MDHHQQPGRPRRARRPRRPRDQDPALSVLARERLVPPGRIVGLDVARCLALIGMIATHTLAPTTPAGEVTVVQQVAGGRSAALFAVLAGASMALMSGRTEPVVGAPAVRVAARLTVRALFVVTLGLLLGGLETHIAVILTYYGALFLLGIPFLQLRATPLLVLATIGLLVGPVVSQAVRPHLPAPSYDSPHFAMLARPLHLLGELLFTGYYPAATWLPYLVAGIAVGRMALTERRTAVLLAVAGAGAALVAKSVSALLLARPEVYDALLRTSPSPHQPEVLDRALEHGLYGTTPTGSWWWLAVSAPHSGTPLDLLHTIGTSLAVIGGCLLVVPLAPRLLAVVFGAGAMTLTLYSLHVTLRIPPLWSGEGFGVFARHVALVLVIGAAFRLMGRSGPLEWLVARIAAAATGPARQSERGSERGPVPR
ncbi:MAG: heparan-alpha-glucosaminide N-acetyltransferase domain-containing protein [Nocardioides sp.]